MVIQLQEINVRSKDLNLMDDPKMISSIIIKKIISIILRPDFSVKDRRKHTIVGNNNFEKTKK
jgi:hypothetical protein